MPRSTAPMPALDSGDHLTRIEFHQRYCARPDIRKAELVEGVVYVASPVRSDVHGEPHGDVVFWLNSYRALHPELHVSDNATVVLDADNEVQPDACLWREEPAGPRLAGGYIQGPPQLVVEVSATSASYDLHEKFRAYRRNGVKEYVVWRVFNDAIEWFRLNEDGEYVLVEPDRDGVIKSLEFPGLRLSVPKMLVGDLAGVRAALDAR